MILTHVRRDKPSPHLSQSPNCASLHLQRADRNGDCDQRGGLHQDSEPPIFGTHGCSTNKVRPFELGKVSSGNLALEYAVVCRLSWRFVPSSPDTRPSA